MNDTFQKQKIAVGKRKKIYFFLGWPLMICGIGFLFYKPAFVLAVVFLLSGVIMRLLYYYANFEIKSLEKYEKMVNKVKLLFMTGFIFFAVSWNIFGQLERGDDAAELLNVEWVAGKPVKISDKTEKFLLIEFWAPWDQGSVLSFPILSELQEKYGEEKLLIIALTKEKKEKVTEFINRDKTNSDFRIAVDPDGLVVKKYMGAGSGIPKVFIVDKDKEILWVGSPIALESVLKKVFNGTFDPEIQDKITALHKKLQANMQLEKINEVIKISDKIIELDPSDELALRVRLFAFERSGKIADSSAFIDRLIEKSPKTSLLYFVKLDLMNRLNLPVEDINKTCELIFAKFAEDHEVLERLAWTAVSRMKFGTAPLSIALKSSDKAVSMLIESNYRKPVKLANYLETQARVYYSIGRLDKAVEIQERVVRLRKGDPVEKEAAVRLDYYREARDVRDP